MNRKDFPEEPVIGIEILYKGRYLDLERMKVRLATGRTTSREVVRVKDTVAVLPVDDDGRAHLVRQHRHAIDTTLVEVPAGLIDPGESAREAAKRECAEEIGYRPVELIELLRYAHAEGYSTGFMTLYLGTALKPDKEVPGDATESLEPVSMDYPVLLEMVRENRIIDSKTILCVLLAREWFEERFGKI
jgi:ADP-ribose pyrophosphatase